MDHQGEGPGDDEEAGDLLTPGRGASMGGREAIMQKTNKEGKDI